MEDLITMEGFKQASGIKYDNLAQLTFKALKLDGINQLYLNTRGTTPLAFITDLLHRMEIEVEISEESLQNIPKTGGFITVSNHPFGGLDGIILLYLILKQRETYQLMSNNLLQRIEPIRDALIPVNSLKEHTDTSSFGGMRKAIDALANDLPVGFFPAGEVSSWDSQKRKVSDKPWNKSVIRLIKKAEKPILPIYFKGGNSPLFYSLALLHPTLQTAKLPSELTNKKKKTIKVIIGKAISVREQNSFTNIEKFSKYLRTRTYCLDTTIDHKKFYSFPKFSLPTKKVPIAAFETPENLAQMVSKLPTETLLFSAGKFDVYCAKAPSLGLLMDEIGKLREATFRAVGEGTGKEKDLDEFDLYYHHLFIWDREQSQIVGAYRLGDGKSIIERYDKHGFYISTLFKWKDSFNDVLKESLELGRSFIQPAYQKQPQSLFLLWKGILYFLLKNDHYRYLVGPVSISGDYSSLSKSLIIRYIQANYYNTQWSKFIKARRKFRYLWQNADINIDELDRQDLDKLDGIIESIEPNHFKLPVLLKKYVKQNAKFIGFNLDPAFNNCLDGLIMLDLKEIDMPTVYSLSKEMNAPDILKRIETLQQN